MSEELTAAVRVNFLAFALKAYAYLNKGKRLTIYPYLKLMAEYLTAFAEGDIKRLLITLPPRHGKTFLASICLAAGSWRTSRRQRSLSSVIAKSSPTRSPSRSVRS
jgi:hypothetical protein